MSNGVSTKISYQSTTTIVIDTSITAAGPKKHDPCALDACMPNPYKGARSKFMEAVDGLPFPHWVKSMIKDAVRGERMPKPCVQPIKAECMPSEGCAPKTVSDFRRKKEPVLTIAYGEKPLPSEFGAAKTINDFQNRHLCGGRISAAQMDQMARTGYLTRSDGSMVKVSGEVQDAARRFMANDAELFKKLESATDGRHDGQLGAGDYFEAFRAGKLCSHEGRTVTLVHRGDDMLPTEADAAKTAHDFQHERLGGERLSAAQMDQMARTGYLTKKDGSTIAVPPDMQKAAQRFMANGGELFRKMESATDGRRDGQLGMGDYRKARDQGLIHDDDRSADVVYRRREFVQPTESNAARTIHDFQKKELSGERLTAGQMDQMARTGYLTRSDGSTVRVPPEVQAAAQRFMTSGGALFKKMESATDGRHDGRLGVGDYDEAIACGRICRGGDKREVVAARGMQILPTESGAARTVHDFQRDQLGGERLSAAQMDQMARTGYLTRSDGSTVRVPPDVQKAAQRFMAGGGELFRKMESATDGRRDGQLGMGDYDQARIKGRIAAHEHGCDVIVRRDEYQLPSASGAAHTIHDFQQDTLNGERLTAAQMDEMARTGYLTRSDGRIVAVPSAVQDAARRFMANGGELFRKMESATDGRHDGRLGVGDYDKAIDQGTIRRHHGHCAVSTTAGERMLPSEPHAAKKIRDFQRDDLDCERLSVAQMDQMARTGYLTKKDGSTIAVPPAVQDAARRFMANDAELFKKMESATDGKHDGQLGVGDYDRAFS